MIQGSPGANISQYGQYISNCTKGQMPFKVPITSLADVQLYIQIGTLQPDAIAYELIHTCGGGGTETLPNPDYIIGQDTNNNWYGLFKNFTGAAPSCFVIAITLSFGMTDVIYFSEEYCIDNYCSNLTFIKGCYGNLDNKISYDAQGIYFGTPMGAGAMGNMSLVYKHELYIRGSEVYLIGIKNTFKQGVTRTFRTEKEKVFQFNADFVPEWFIHDIDAVFYRGEVFIRGIKYLVNETLFELIEECKKIWKPAATLKDSHTQSYSCESDPCAPPPEEPCCDPIGVTATVISNVCCEPVVTGVLLEEI